MAKRRPLDTLALLQRLHASGVNFVIIGGVAAITYGGAVTTEDLDVCAPLDTENAKAIIRAFADTQPQWRMRLDLPVITPDAPQLIGLKNLSLATELGQLDVLGELPNHCSYAALAARAVTVDFDGLACQLIDLDTLIEAKRAAGRPHDLRTVTFLEQIRRIKKIDAIVRCAAKLR